MVALMQLLGGIKKMTGLELDDVLHGAQPKDEAK